VQDIYTFQFMLRLFHIVVSTRQTASFSAIHHTLNKITYISRLNSLIDRLTD